MRRVWEVSGYRESLLEAGRVWRGKGFRTGSGTFGDFTAERQTQIGVAVSTLVRRRSPFVEGLTALRKGKAKGNRRSPFAEGLTLLRIPKVETEPNEEKL